jgi:hypothetical protein
MIRLLITIVVALLLLCAVVLEVAGLASGHWLAGQI